ncbi:MAG: hypothetical protein GY792_26530 [Gammaproteobacteria bacterium]|nr:hypothetical protein [Gammaproteobacteria bacterium]
MIIPNMNASEFRTGPKKFVRRSDLSSEIRIQIACAAIVAKASGQWGVITELSRQYLVSRTFVYMLASTLQDADGLLFGDPCSILAARDETVPYRYMLSLRLEGCCSIGAISTLMQRFDIPWSSTGKISHTLHDIGSLLPKTLSTRDGKIQLVVFLSDELFAKARPILVTVEPQSTAVLRIELSETRQWEDWKAHWECLEENGYHAIYLVSDGGQALSRAQKEALKDIVRQPDTYHAIAHVLGQFVTRLEQKAYRAIEKEDARWHTLDSARSDAVIEKRIAQYERACRTAADAIDLSENIAYLYGCLVGELAVFDETGQLRNRQKAEGSIEAALDLLDTLGVGYVSDAVKKVRRTLPELLHYFDVAETVVAQLNGLPCEKETLRTLCVAHQWQKRLMKAKTSEARRYCAAQEQFYLDVATDDLHENYDELKVQVYRQLDQIVQSSSLVECINSIIRPYLNTTRNHVTQELLNLVMFYHNHRRYKDGKRQGNTPMEMLTGTPQKQDWLDLLFEEIEKKQPGFFGSSR